MADEIRFIGSNLNFRVDPNTGDVIDANPSTPGVQGHLIPLPIGNYVAAAYTENHPGATTTTLYVINTATDHLGRVGGRGGTPSPNTGTVTDIGPLNQPTNGNASLDAALPTDNLFAWVNSVGFALVDSHNGELLTIGAVGPGTGLCVRDLAVLALPATMYALTDDSRLLRFWNFAPNVSLGEAAITGLVDQAGGELLQAIALRASTGQLYALSNRAGLYTINPLDRRSGVPRHPRLVARRPRSGWTLSRPPGEIRIVSDNGVNIRVHPETFAVTEGAKLSTRGVIAIGYTHLPPAGSGQTLFAFTPTTYAYIGGLGGTPSPDTGVVNIIDPLGFEPSLQAGYDFSVADNMALAAGRFGTVDRLELLESRHGNSQARRPDHQLRRTCHRPGVRAARPRAVRRVNRLAFMENAGPAILTLRTHERQRRRDCRRLRDHRRHGHHALRSGQARKARSSSRMARRRRRSRCPSSTTRAPESPETVIMTLSMPMLGAQLGATTSFVLTINDDDTPPNPPPTITIVNPTNQPGVRDAERADHVERQRARRHGDRQGRVGERSRRQRHRAGTSPWTAIDIPAAVRRECDHGDRDRHWRCAGHRHDHGGRQRAELSASRKARRARSSISTSCWAIRTGRAAPVSITFLKEGGSTIVQTLTLPGHVAHDARVDQIAGLEATAVSTIVTSTSTACRWSSSARCAGMRSGYGAHTEKAVDSAGERRGISRKARRASSRRIIAARESAGTAPNARRCCICARMRRRSSRTYDRSRRSRA